MFPVVESRNQNLAKRFFGFFPGGEKLFFRFKPFFLSLKKAIRIPLESLIFALQIWTRVD
ncbi:hypothetical protein EPD60_00735 [Flaviaesturariibacter flavus]|uniref:Uncharacterized protein n=1 Tax=Flaviaesturariibacter flavus TaxID=2502780 RepID=A0A4R1BND4_9BACT|nr:hypothetical protein [Flaviaesturariibacter flavus]TCJ18971.1 hypothetical protein EPD60_00735 [Flaviaesturariibacter flavus]